MQGEIKEEKKGAGKNRIIFSKRIEHGIRWRRGLRGDKNGWRYRKGCVKACNQQRWAADAPTVL